MGKIKKTHIPFTPSVKPFANEITIELYREIKRLAEKHGQPEEKFSAKFQLAHLGDEWFLESVVEYDGDLHEKK